MKKPNTSIVAPAIALAAAFAVLNRAHADTAVDAYRSNFETADTFVFEKLVTGNTYVWCGTTGDVFDENWCVWESAEVDGVRTNGILQTGDYFRTADAWNQKARLRIGSGSYTFPYVQLGKAGTSYVVVTGGVLRASSGDIQVGINGGDSTFVLSNGTVSAAYWLTAGRDAATTSRIEVHGGSLTTAYRDGVEQTGNTGNGMIDLASHANSKATFLQTGGRVHAAGSANNGDKNIAMSVGNGTHAEASVELTGGEMDLDGILDIPRDGTGAFTMAGGSLDVLSEVFIANGDNSVGTFTVTGGTVNVQSFMQVARGSGSTATFAMSNATVDVSRYIAVGFGANSTADVDVSGGTLNLKGNTEGIGFLIGDNAGATHSAFKVRGNGIVNTAADSYVGWNSAGTLTIKDDGYVGVGGATNHRWLKINNYAAVTGHSEINLDGGTLDVCHIRMIQPGDGSADVNFNGGAINVYANNSNASGNLFGNVSTGDLRVYIKENGGTISVANGASIAANEPLLSGVEDGTDGGFTKKGDGTLTLASGNTYAGPTVVEGGSLVLPEGETLASTQLELAGGTFSGTTFDDITISAGEYSFSSLPTNTTGTVTLNGGILRMTVAEAQATADTAKVVVNGGTLLIDGSTAESVSVGSSFTFGNITLGDNVEAADVVKVSGVNFDWTYGSSDGHPTATAGTASGENVWVGGNKGYWNDAANWSYGVPGTELSAVFRNDAVVSFNGLTTVPTLGSLKIETDNVTLTRDSASADKFHLTEFGGYGTLTLNNLGCTQVNGSTLVVTNDIVFTGTSWLGDYDYNGLVQMEGDMLVESGNTCQLWSTVNVYGDISGGGNLVIKQSKNTGAFYGDNSGFTGTFEKSDCDFRFMKPESGFPNATSVTINGTIWLWFDEGEIEFGGNFTAWSTGNCGINLPGTVRAVTMTVGGGNGSVIISRGWDKKAGWRSYYSAFVDSNGWKQGTDKFTLRKVGTGAITEYGVQSDYNFSLEGGAINLGAEKVYTGPDTRLTVANATLGIAAATTVASADFKSGSTLLSTYYETTEEETTTYGVNLLTVTGAATLNGLTLTAAGTTPNVDTTYTVLSAESVSGSAESGVADSDETDKKVWIAKVRQDSVMLMYGSRQPGFFVIIH